jgi:hypothetical protein
VTTDLRQRKHIFRQTSNFSVLLLQDVPVQQTRVHFMRKKIKKSQKGISPFFIPKHKENRKNWFFSIFMSKHEEN